MRALACAALAAALGGTALAGDVIVLADGRTVGTQKSADPPGPADFAASNLTVTEENSEAVIYRLAGVPTKQTIPRPQVRRVVHDPATVPADLTEGLALLAQRSFDEGRAKLVAVARNPAAPAWAQAEAAFRHAESYWTEGNTTGAERALGTFAQERTRSRFVLDARRLRARIFADIGRDEAAKAEYEALSRVPGATDDEALGARFLAAWSEARSAMRAADAARIAAAAKSFDDLRSRAGGRAAVIARCDVAKAACGGAVDPLASVVAASEDPFVLAVGNTLLADAARRGAAGGKDRAALEGAQERYLRAVLLFRDAEGAADFVAAAQFHAGELFLELAEGDAAAAAEAKARARREWEDLVRRLPRSEWARKARTALEGL